MEKKDDLERIKKVYSNTINLLKDKIKISRGETEHLLTSINYYIKKFSSDDKTQFEKDSESIKKALEDILSSKIKTFEDDLKKVDDRLKKDLNINNEHLQILLLIDCMQNRIYSISQKIEYLYTSYKHLIEPYNFHYIPTPSVYKRINTSNLMLYFNQSTNEKYKILKEYFFEIEDGENETEERVFSTWNYSTLDHIKEIDDSKRAYLSLNFWFFENSFLYPIAFHEMAHNLYKNHNSNTNDNKKNIFLTENDEKNIKEELNINLENFNLDIKLVNVLYQDIVSDFCAYSLSGISYILSFFYSTFSAKMHKFFYNDVDIKNIDKKIKNIDRQCSNQEKTLTILNWGLSNDIRKLHLITWYIRVKLLIKLHEEINSKETKEESPFKKFTEEIENIKIVLNLIFPDNYKLNINTFKGLLINFNEKYQQYEFLRNFTLLLYSIFEEFVFENKELNKNVRKVIDNIKETNRNKIKKENKNTKKIFIKLLNNININIHTTQSKYDLYWYIRLTENKYIGRIHRTLNLLELGYEEYLQNINLEDIVYELVYFKFANKDDKNIFSHIFKDVNNKLDRVVFNDIINSKNEFKIDVKNISYAFGPYDIAILFKNRTNDIDEFLRQLNNFDEKNNENINFFTSRHALFLLDEKEKNNKSNNVKKETCFDLIISIDLNKELTPQGNKNFKNFYENNKNNLLESCNNLKLFASLGNENLVLYFNDFDLSKINDVIKILLSEKSIKFTYTTLLLNKLSNKFPKNKDLELELLCKLKNNNNKSSYEKLEAIKSELSNLQKEKNINLKSFVKLGTYDLTIIIENCDNENVLTNIKNIIDNIGEYLDDIQIEPHINLENFIKEEKGK